LSVEEADINRCQIMSGYIILGQKQTRRAQIPEKGRVR